VLALVNEPDFNPNNRAGLRSGTFRNRAVTDLFEPGSTLKPFTVAVALESGKFTAGTVIDTTPGSLQIGDRIIRDVHNYGVLTVAGVIEKSSNVSASKIALALQKKPLEMLRRVGFGDTTARGCRVKCRRFSIIALGAGRSGGISYGYGISVTRCNWRAPISR
jgi:cell division protein FtsI (penicillin-binding protein 3)